MRFFRRYYMVYVLLLGAVFGAGLLILQHSSHIRAVFASQSPACVIVIDPGHGGEDGGAVSARGVKESTLNLEISLRLDDLCALLGLPTRLLRSEDTALYGPEAQTVSEKKVSDLKRRVQLVNDTPGALLVSIHQNSFPESKYRGAQVFYAATERSKELAELLQARIGTALDPDNHRVSKPSEQVYLMEHIQCTGILLECGFLTNPTEAALLCTEAYQKQLCCTVASALTTFFTNHG